MSEFVYTNKMNADDYIQLREAIGFFTLTQKQAEQGLANTTFLVCAEVDGQTIAMGRALYDFGYICYIGDIIVLPQYQRQGIGTKIVKSLIEKIMETVKQGETIMFILGAAQGKEAFYEKFGFKQHPNAKFGAGMSMYITKQN